jgi:hypothetical protein
VACSATFGIYLPLMLFSYSSKKVCPTGGPLSGNTIPSRGVSFGKPSSVGGPVLPLVTQRRMMITRATSSSDLLQLLFHQVLFRHRMLIHLLLLVNLPRPSSPSAHFPSGSASIPSIDPFPKLEPLGAWLHHETAQVTHPFADSTKLPLENRPT